MAEESTDDEDIEEVEVGCLARDLRDHGRGVADHRAGVVGCRSAACDGATAR